MEVALELPGYRQAGVRGVRTKRAGLDGDSQVLSKGWIMLANSAQGGFDGMGNTGTRSLDRRGCHPRSPSEPTRPGQLLGEKFDFRLYAFDAARIVEGLCLSKFFSQFL